MFAFGQQQEALREILRGISAILAHSGASDTRSAAILRQTRRSWDEDIKAQTQNYTTLLEELAQLLAASTPPPS